VLIEPAGRVAVVTGGSRGIGAAIAKTLAAAGASVLVVFREDETGALAVVAEIEAAGGLAACRQADVRDGEAIAAAMDKAAARAGRLDILVNNAGIVRDALVPRCRVRLARGHRDEPLRRVPGVPGGVSTHAARRWGRIVNISSVGAWRGNRGQGNYAASKAAVNALTRVMANEFGLEASP